MMLFKIMSLIVIFVILLLNKVVKNILNYAIK